MSTINVTPIERGFNRGEFVDCYGLKCSLQESSSAEEARIWLGISKLQISVMAPNLPWQELGEKEIRDAFKVCDVVGHTRMHLNQEQVKALLPLLQKFAETGSLE